MSELDRLVKLSRKMEQNKWWSALQEGIRGTGWTAFPEDDSEIVHCYQYETKESRYVATSIPPAVVVAWLKEHAEFKKANLKVVKELEANIKTHAPLNIQSLPRVQVGEHITCSDTAIVGNPGIPEGSWIAVSHSMDGWLTPDVTYEEMSQQTAPFKGPCKCESLLKGHDDYCEHNPNYGRVLTPEETERQRLENVWAIPKPREMLSYKTSSDFGMSHMIDQCAKVGKK